MALHDTTWPDEGGEARMRRALSRAERHHRRRRGYAVAAGAVIAIVLVLAGLGSLALAIASPAAPRRTVSAPAAGSPEPAPIAVPAATPTATVRAEAPDASAAQPRPKPKAKTAPSAPVQRFRIRIGGLGFEPSSVSAKAGVPIVIAVDRGEGCAAGFYMPALRVKADNSSGPVTVKLGRVKPGRYRFTCAMGMVEGTLIVR